MGSDWLDIVEHAYRLDLDEAPWLEGVLEAIRAKLDQGFGAGALLYDASSLTSIQPRRFILQGGPPALTVEDSVLAIPHDRTTPEFIHRTFGQLTCGYVSKTFGLELPRVLDRMNQSGIVDLFAVNGVDPSLRGCLVGIHLSRATRFPARTRAMCHLVATHVASAYRLRRRLVEVGDTIEAVLSPRGKIEHAEGVAAEGDARDSLRDAVKALERARGRMRREDPENAIFTWKGLVDARWSLVDHFETDGKRYIVAQCNTADALTFDVLSPRERQVAAYAALGHQNKFIAYELGINVSTVGVLLSRAYKKLRVRSRAALSRAYTVRK